MVLVKPSSPPALLGNAALLGLPFTARLSSRRAMPSAAMRWHDRAMQLRDAGTLLGASRLGPG